MGVFHIIVVWLRSLLRSRAELAAENLALRQQLAVLRRSAKRLRLKKRDRALWAWKGPTGLDGVTATNHHGQDKCMRSVETT